ncbi:MAG: DUF1552 domain-containing protein, partial [Myxococcota bacterium]
DYTLMKHFYPGGFPGAIPFLSTGVYNNQEHPNVFHRVWNDSPQPASLGAPVTDPRELFRTLFGRYPGATSDATTSESFAARRRSILDGVMAQFRELTGDASSLSARSKARLSDHFDHVRSLEVSIAESAVLNGCDEPEIPNGAYLENPRSFGRSAAHLRQQFRVNVELMAIALRCDLTRFAHVLNFAMGEHAQIKDGYTSRSGQFIDFDEYGLRAKELGSLRDWHNNNHTTVIRDQGDDDRSSRRAFAREFTGAFTQLQLDNLADVMEVLDSSDHLDPNNRTLLENSVFIVAQDLGSNHDGDSVFHAVGPDYSAGSPKFKTGLLDYAPSDAHSTKRFYDAVLDAYNAPPIFDPKSPVDADPLPGVVA